MLPVRMPELCRYRFDGSDPTASVGIIIPDGGSFEIWGYDDISNFRAIRTGAVSSELTASFSRA